MGGGMDVRTVIGRYSVVLYCPTVTPCSYWPLGGSEKCMQDRDRQTQHVKPRVFILLAAMLALLDPMTGHAAAAGDAQIDIDRRGLPLSPQTTSGQCLRRVLKPG